MNKFDAFIKNADMELTQYTAFRQKKIAGLPEKGVFKVVITKDIPSNASIFNSRFVDKIKNPGIDKAYEKIRLVVQAYNDQKNYFIVT